MESKDFDLSKIERVPIESVHPNSYNPKIKRSKEFAKVVDSIRKNGLKQYIFVREVEGVDGFVIVDGEQRWTAASDLGYKEIYIYNLGKISEDEAKSLTIWFEVQVPFDEIDLAPIVVELTDKDVALPYSESEVSRFSELVKFDFDDYKSESPLLEDDFDNFIIRLTPKEFDFIQSRVDTIQAEENVNEGRALELLIADNLSEYEIDF